MTYRPNDYPNKPSGQTLSNFDPYRVYPRRGIEGQPLKECHPVHESERGKGDDIDCAKCGAKDAADSGLECQHCGHDMWRDVYGEDRPAKSQEWMHCS